LRIPIRAGRFFAESDGPDAEQVAIVNEELARRHWPGENPIGKRIRMENEENAAPWMTIVGVAGNMLSRGPDSGFNPEIYVPDRQYPWVQTPKNLVVRARAGLAAASLSEAIVREVHRVDLGQPVADIRTMEEVAAGPIAQQKMVMALLGAFAALALILSAVGIYSVQAYSVAQRTREIGVRMALGAQPRDVLQMVLGGGTLLLVAGIAAGAAAALALTRLMSDLLFGVRPTDPATFVGVAIFLGLVSLVACYLPARRAAKVDPMTALRYE
jgi:putative ABC transport system permease protein